MGLIRMTWVGEPYTCTRCGKSWHTRRIADRAPRAGVYCDKKAVYMMVSPFSYAPGGQPYCYVCYRQWQQQHLEMIEALRTLAALG